MFSLEGAWYVECVGDDVDHSGVASFRQLAQANADESVVFAWITFEPKAHRDQVNEAIFAVPRIIGMIHANAQPSYSKRLEYAGFDTTVTG